MKKLFPKIFGFILTFAIIFAVSGLSLPHTGLAQSGTDNKGSCIGGSGENRFNLSGMTYDQCMAQAKGLGTTASWIPDRAPGQTPETNPALEAKPDSTGFWGGLANALAFIPGVISIGILKIASLLTYLAGALLNLVVQYSVVDMKEHLDEADAVNNAWKVIRDVANMTFIFVLLYAAIKTILGIGSDTKKLIVNIVVVAILINFSLFFTKVVIDASNILAVTFYDAIAPGALTGTATGLLGKTGIADSLMQPLNLTSIWNTTGLSGTKILTVGIMGTIVTLIAAFVFFAIALMFIIRFVVLIFVLILSPIAFIAFILPQAEKYRKQWVDALTGQAFFAPIYFMLTWIVIVVSRGLLPSTGGSMADALSGTIGASSQAQAPTADELQILLNFIIMIALLISSLMIAKEWANKAGGAVSGITKWATGAAGGATLGLAGRFGRGTFGRAGGALSESEGLKDAVAKGGVKGMAARLALATTRKTAGYSFDVRGTGIGDVLDAGKAQKGGFTKDLEEKIKAEKKYADSLKPSNLLVAKAEKELEDAKKGTDAERIRIAQDEVDRLKGASEEDIRKREIKKRREEHYDRTGILKTEKDIKKDLEVEENKRRVVIRDLKRGGLSHDEATRRAKLISRENGGWAPDKVKGVGVERKEAYVKDKEKSTTVSAPIPFTNSKVNPGENRRVRFSWTGRTGFIGKVKRERLEEADAIRKSIKEKKPAEKIAEEIKTQTENAAEETAAPESTTPPTTGGTTPTT